jgi:predicted aminopeptidase
MATRLLFVLCTLLLVSCEAARFYSQAVGGQLAIVSKREKIDTLIADPATDPNLKTRLEGIQGIRTFADTSLGLPVEKNFSTYVDLGRPFVVWNVFAAPEFSMTPKNWCYPVAGCVTYRGYFSEDAAREYADNLSAQGLDVYVGGVAAYSTLGWFSDSVLNTVINRDRFRLAALIFHELAHQVVYIPGDTEFNESFATTVEQEGLKRWLAANESAEQATRLVAETNRERDYQQQFVGLVKDYVPRFEALYAKPLATEDMRGEKSQLIDQMRLAYQALKNQWQGYDAYDGWFNTGINNAKLNTVATYYNLVPAFEKLLAECNYDLPAFYVRIEALSKLSKTQRDKVLSDAAMTTAVL